MPPEASADIMAALNYPYGPRKQSQGHGYRWDLQNPVLQTTYYDMPTGQSYN